MADPATQTDAALLVKRLHEPQAHPGTGPTCAQKRREVTLADLPLSCPMPDMTLWDAHPRIYLPIVDDGGESICPYCNTHYVLRD